MTLGTILAFVVWLAIIDPQLWGFAGFMWAAYGFHKLTERYTPS